MGGLLTYLVAGIAAVCWLTGAAEITYAIDDRLPITAKVNMLFVANGAYTGAGMHIAPSASLDDGRFDVLILEHAEARDSRSALLPAIYRGAHLNVIRRSSTCVRAESRSNRGPGCCSRLMASGRAGRRPSSRSRRGR